MTDPALLEEARALVLRCAPNGDPARVNIAAHQIAGQIEMVRAGLRGGDLTRWRGAFDLPPGYSDGEFADPSKPVSGQADDDLVEF